MEKLWTTGEVATFLKIEETEVEQLVVQGRLTGYKLGGRFLRFRPDQVQALKGRVDHAPGTLPPQHRWGMPWLKSLREFLYFYDFYVVSATLLAVTAVYLIVAG